MRAGEALVFALPCAWWGVAIHWFCNCNHRSQTQRIFVMSFVSPLHAWLEALGGAELNAQQSDGAVFTLAWDIYHLPPCDVGSKRHWDEQYVRHGAGLTPGLWERLLLCFSQLQAVFPRGEMNSLNDFYLVAFGIIWLFLSLFLHAWKKGTTEFVIVLSLQADQAPHKTAQFKVRISCKQKKKISLLFPNVWWWIHFSNIFRPNIMCFYLSFHSRHLPTSTLEILRWQKFDW